MNDSNKFRREHEEALVALEASLRRYEASIRKLKKTSIKIDLACAIAVGSIVGCVVGRTAGLGIGFLQHPALVQYEPTKPIGEAVLDQIKTDPKFEGWTTPVAMEHFKELAVAEEKKRKADKQAADKRVAGITAAEDEGKAWGSYIGPAVGAPWAAYSFAEKRRRGKVTEKSADLKKLLKAEQERIQEEFDSAHSDFTHEPSVESWANCSGKLKDLRAISVMCGLADMYQSTIDTFLAAKSVGDAEASIPKSQDKLKAELDLYLRDDHLSAETLLGALQESYKNFVRRAKEQDSGVKQNR